MAQKFTTPTRSPGKLQNLKQTTDRRDVDNLLERESHNYQDTENASGTLAQRQAKNPAFSSKSEAEHHGLQGMGSQFAGTANHLHGAGTAHYVPVHGCPIHGHLLDEHRPSLTHGQGKSLLDRYHSEGAGEQHALHVRSDTGRLSTNKKCPCIEAFGNDMDFEEYLAK